MTIDELKFKVAQFLRNTRDVKSCSTHPMTLEYNDGVEYALTIVYDWITDVKYESNKL